MNVLEEKCNLKSTHTGIVKKYIYDSRNETCVNFVEIF